MKDHFSTLGVEPSANDEEIKKAYKKLAMKHHPDRGGDQSKFQEIQEAYDTLSNPQKRAQWEQERQFGGAGGPGGFHFNFGFGHDINDIFRQFTGGGFRHAPQRNRDLRLGIEIDLESTLEELCIPPQQISPSAANFSPKSAATSQASLKVAAINFVLFTGSALQASGLLAESILIIPLGLTPYSFNF